MDFQMKQYTVNTELWWKGNLLEAGAQLSLSEKQVKYLKHAVTEVVPEAEQAPEQQTSEEPEAFDEADETSKRSKRGRRHVEASNGDAGD